MVSDSYNILHKLQYYIPRTKKHVTRVAAIQYRITNSAIFKIEYINYGKFQSLARVLKKRYYYKLHSKLTFDFKI